jgi:hypothetical protein
MYAGYTNLAAKAYYNSGHCFEQLREYTAAVRTYQELADNTTLAALPEATSARDRIKQLLGPEAQ